MLDLEGLARHRGSLLGDLPDEPQPSQKAFESQARWPRSSASIPRVRCSSNRRAARSATVQVPDALLAAMRAAPCVRLDTPTAVARRAAEGRVRALSRRRRTRSRAARAPRPAARQARRSSAGTRTRSAASSTRSSTSCSCGTTIRRTRASIERNFPRCRAGARRARRRHCRRGVPRARARRGRALVDEHARGARA